MEYWDLYNEKREPLHRIRERHEVFEPGEFYTCVEVWIVNLAGEILTTQRSPKKKRGGMWEFTGGGVMAGETTRQAGVREVKEELGITLAEEELKLFTTYQHKNYFMDLYVVKKELQLDTLVLQQDEVSDAKFVSKEEFLQMCQKEEVVYSVGQRFINYECLISQ